MTSDLWFPAAERIPGAHSAGLAMAGGGYLLTHHITVSPQTSYSSTRDYLVHEGFEPTLILDPWQGHRGQFLPGDRGAYALKHAGGPETNREGRIHIQVEWLSPAMSVDLSTAPHFAEIWHDLCIWSRALGVPYVWAFGDPLSTSRDPATWRKSGHRGHRNAPGNDHVDSLHATHAPWPAATPQKPHHPPAPTPTPDPTPQATEDDMWLIKAADKPETYGTNFAGDKWHIPDPAVRDEIIRVTGRQVQIVAQHTLDALKTV